MIKSISRHTALMFRRQVFNPCWAFVGSMMFFVVAVHAEDFATFNARFGQQPVQAQVMQEGAPTGQVWNLIGIEDSQIEVRLPGGGEMGLDPTPQLATQLRFPDFASDVYRAAIRAERFADAVRELRPRVYPLLRFGALPAGFTGVHDAIEALFQGLAAAELLDESLAIFNAYPDLIQRERYQREAFRLIQRLAEAGETGKAVTLLGRIPVENLPEGLISALLSFASDLRVRGEYAALIPVYEAMIPELKGGQRREAQIWLAYSHAAIDQSQESEAIFAAIEGPGPQDDGFGLYQLLIGYRLYRQNNFEEALDALARGMVFSRSNESWIPEALFYIGSAYRRLERLTPARNTFEEIFRLFPDSQWAARAREQHEAIAKQIEALQARSE
jgi:tetratricopeptide (TPR) repeat protein